jgi:phage terminase large subunit GpA-like protein
MTGSKSMFSIPGIVQIRMQDDGNKIWFIEVDNTKALVQDRYFLGAGQPGFTEVPRDVTQGYMMSLTAEKREYSGGDDGFVWVKIRRRNDYLDCRSYGVAGAMYLAQKMKREDATLDAKVESNRQMAKGTGNTEQKANFLIRKEEPAKPSPKRRPTPPRQNWFGASGRYFS